MQLKSLGKVTATAGTKVRLTANRADPLAPYFVYDFIAVALKSNTKPVYISETDGSDMNLTTLAKVSGILAVPTLSTGQPIALPSFGASLPNIPFDRTQALDLSRIWLDVEVTGEGCLVSVLEV